MLLRCGGLFHTKMYPVLGMNRKFTEEVKVHIQDLIKNEKKLENQYFSVTVETNIPCLAKKYIFRLWSKFVCPVTREEIL